MRENKRRSYCQPRRLLVIRTPRSPDACKPLQTVLTCWRRRELWRMMAAKNGAIKLVAGNSNPALAEAIAAYLKTPMTRAVVRRFADMEIFVEIQENVRGSDVFVIQSTSFPTNDHLMELLIIIDALRRASGRRITAVIPVFRLCPAGPQARPAYADLGQAGRQPDHPCRRRPRDDARSPCRADPRLLRHPDRQSLCLADDGARHQGALRPRQGGDRVAGRGRRRPCARACQAHQRAARHRRQAARTRRQIRSDERDRRGQGPRPAS